MKTPFFYHIPKNAGTYFLSYTLLLGRAMAVKIFGIPAVDYLRQISVKKGNLNVATIIVLDSAKKTLQNNSVFKHTGSIEYTISLKDFLNCKADDALFANLDIIAFMVESPGFLLRNSLLDFFSNKEILECLIDREPVSRQKSIYRYLTSKDSIHEATHHNFSNNLDFDAYISHHMHEEDCWLIRKLTGKDYPNPITEDDFEATCKILDSVFIKDIKQTNQFIIDVYQECRGFNPNQYINDFKKNLLGSLFKNESSNKKPITINNLENIEDKLSWATKLYRKYND